MSLEEFEYFINSDNKEFMNKAEHFASRQKSRGGISRKDSLEFFKNDVIPFARQKGFDFTIDDILNFKQSLKTNALRNVSAGKDMSPSSKLLATILGAAMSASLGSGAAYVTRSTQHGQAQKDTSNKNKQEEKTQQQEDTKRKEAKKEEAEQEDKTNKKASFASSSYQNKGNLGFFSSRRVTNTEDKNKDANKSAPGYEAAKNKNATVPGTTLARINFNSKGAITFTLSKFDDQKEIDRISNELSRITITSVFDIEEIASKLVKESKGNITTVQKVLLNLNDKNTIFKNYYTSIIFFETLLGKLGKSEAPSLLLKDDGLVFYLVLDAVLSDSKYTCGLIKTLFFGQCSEQFVELVTKNKNFFERIVRDSFNKIPALSAYEINEVFRIILEKNPEALIGLSKTCLEDFEHVVCSNGGDMIIETFVMMIQTGEDARIKHIHRLLAAFFTKVLRENGTNPKKIKTYDGNTKTALQSCTKCDSLVADIVKEVKKSNPSFNEKTFKDSIVDAVRNS